MFWYCYIENISKIKISLWQIWHKKHSKMVLTTIQYILITQEKLELGRETEKANIFPRSYVIKSEAEFEFPKLLKHPLVSFKKKQQHEEKLLLTVNLHMLLLPGSQKHLISSCNTRFELWYAVLPACWFLKKQNAQYKINLMSYLKFPLSTIIVAGFFQQTKH